MPLPDWLKQHDDADEPQPAAAAPVPEEEPDEPEPQAPEPEGAEPEAGPTAQVAEDEASAPRAPAAPVVIDEVPATGNDQVLGMLAAIEQQLRHLGDVQRQHEDQLASLIDRSALSVSGAAEDEEPEPQQKQPSFVVEMDEDAQAPQGEGSRQDLQDMASELETSRQQTDRMRQQLEDAQTRIKNLGESSGDDEEGQTQELAEAYEKIEALQSRVIELEAVAAVDDDDADADEKDERIAELSAQVTKLQGALRARDEAEPPPVPAPPPDSAGAEMIERQRKQIERLTEQLAALNTEADPMAIHERDARIAELEEELEELRGQADGKQGVGKLVAGFGGALRQARGKKGSGDEQEVAELEERIAELEVECQRLRQAAQNAGAGSSGGSGDEGEEIAALRARVAELESNPAAAGGELRSKVETEFRQKWNELKQKQDALTAAEEKMRRQWARPQAVVVLGWLVGLAIVVAAMSWLVAGRMFPPTIVASVSVEAKMRTGVPISNEDRMDWQKVHTEMLGNEAFRQTVAKRLADKRFDDYKDPDELIERLEDDLTVDSPKPGAITLTLAGKNRRETTAVLDTLATSLATWSAQQAGKRGDGAVAYVRGERRDKGQVRYASINDTPIRDRRVFGAVFLFVVGFIISYFLITRISQGLLKAKSAMDEDEFGVSTDGF